MSTNCCACTEVAKQIQTVYVTGPQGDTGDTGATGATGAQGDPSTGEGDVVSDTQSASYTVTGSYAAITGISVALDNTSVKHMVFYAGTFTFTHTHAKLYLKLVHNGVDVAGSERIYGGASATSAGIPAGFSLPVTLQHFLEGSDTGDIEVHAKVDDASKVGDLTEGVLQAFETYRA